MVVDSEEDISVDVEYDNFACPLLILEVIETRRKRSTKGFALI
jgi:hypothetical protein